MTPEKTFYYSVLRGNAMNRENFMSALVASHDPAHVHVYVVFSRTMFSMPTRARVDARL